MMELEKIEEVVIVGAGIAGLATAVGLKRVGVSSLVLESSAVLRTAGAALTLFPNAWLALHSLGVSHKLTPFYLPLRGSSVTNVATGAVNNITFSSDNGWKETGPRGVHRKALLEALAEELPAHSIRFSSKLSSVEIQEHGGASLAVLRLNDGTTIKSKVLIGCDGVNSIVGKWLGLSTPIHSGRFGIRGLSYFPEGHHLGQEALQFVDVGKRAGLIPLNDNEIYWFLTSSQGEEMTREPGEAIQKAVMSNYAKNFPAEFLNSVSHTDLPTLTCAPLMLRQPWKLFFGKLSKGNITVCGDAMHPMTPDLGQGGCSSLEDGVVLSRHIGNSFIQKGGALVAEEMRETLQRYVEERRWRVAALIGGSYLSGWVQQGGSSWLRKFVRDVIFYPFLARRVFSATAFDCEPLPEPHLHLSKKID
ncbi:FAD/NAD(P)-binding oxidoreductase family protein [Euphorbia peplus]|nr:FAD/NAD(P)-binding oxidoreductase family protein [Euphorbia peplus]